MSSYPSESATSAGRYSLTHSLVRAFSIDLRTIALFRVLIGAIIIADLLLRSRDFTAFFTDAGVMPRASVVRYYGDWSWSLYQLSGSYWFAIALVSFAYLAALALIVGYRSRLMAIISWILLISLHNRTGLINSAADDLLRLLLFWSIFLPLGARWSLDQALTRPASSPASITPNPFFGLATVAILMQVMYVYWIGALLKLDVGSVTWHRDYSAVYYALSAEHYATAAGQWFLHQFSGLLPYLTGFVYFIEQYGPLFLVAPFALLWLRMPVLLLLITMHIGFAIFLNVGIFPFVSITSLLLFLPKEFWDWLAERWVKPKSRGVVIYYDEGCQFCLKTVCILKTMLLLTGAKITPAQHDATAGPLLEKHDSWVVKTPDNHYLLEWSALTWLFGRSPIFFWLRWPLRLLGSLKLGNKIYHWIGDRRLLFGRVTAAVLPWRGSSDIQQSEQPTAVANIRERATNALLIILIGYVFHINIASFSSGLLWVPNVVDNALKDAAGLRQRWRMFGNPVSYTSWPVAKGITEDGSTVDVFRDSEQVPSETKPTTYHNNYSNYRWRKYFEKVSRIQNANRRQHYAMFKCKTWNEPLDLKSPKRLVEVAITLGRERTLPDFKKNLLPPYDLGTYRCPD